MYTSWKQIWALDIKLQQVSRQSAGRVNNNNKWNIKWDRSRLSRLFNVYVLWTLLTLTLSCNFGFKPWVIQGVVWLRRNSPKIAPHYSNIGSKVYLIPFFFLSFLPVFLISEYSGTFSLFSSSSWNSRRLSIFLRDFLSLCLSMTAPAGLDWSKWHSVVDWLQSREWQWWRAAQHRFGSAHHGPSTMFTLQSPVDI